MVFPVRSVTEATIRHLENVSIAMAGQKARRCWNCFLYSNGFVYMEFIPEGATVNKARYKEILGSLRDSIRRKRPGFWCSKNWL